MRGECVKGWCDHIYAHIAGSAASIWIEPEKEEESSLLQSSRPSGGGGRTLQKKGYGDIGTHIKGPQEKNPKTVGSKISEDNYVESAPDTRPWGWGILETRLLTSMVK